MKRKTKSLLSRLSEAAKEIKVSSHLDDLDDPSFMKEKMESGKKILDEVGLPKPLESRPRQ